MSMHADWKKAKAVSQKNFKTAYLNWVKELEKKAKAGDAAAREKIVSDQIANMGFSGGGEPVKYFSFDEGFGPALDKLEAAHEKNEKVRAILRKPENELFNKHIMKDKRLAKSLGDACKTTYCYENFDFIFRGHKLDPQKIYDTYISDSAKMQLNIDALKQKWDKAAQDPATLKSKGKELAKKTLDIITQLLVNDSVRKWKLTPAAFAAAGGIDVSKPKNGVQKKSASYRRQVSNYAKRWGKMKPDFWTPCLTALDAIDDRVSKM